jgi:SnoaL-like domain
MSTITTFDLDRFVRAAEERDAATQLSMYGPEATVTVVDKDNQPGSPRVLHGQAEIKGYLDDVAGRDLTHSVQRQVRDEAGAAFTLACRYPDGTNVLCATVFKVDGGQISDQTILQAWDES